MRSPAAPVNRYQPSLQNARSRAEPDCTVPTAGSSDCKSPVTSVYLPTAFVEARHDSESSLTTLKLGQLAWQIMFDYNCIAEPADGARAASERTAQVRLHKVPAIARNKHAKKQATLLCIGGRMARDARRRVNQAQRACGTRTRAAAEAAYSVHGASTGNGP